MSSDSEEKSSVSLIETPIEEAQITTEDDIKITEALKAKFGNRLNGLYDDVVIRFVRGYAHEEKREEQTFIRMEHYLEMCEQYHFETILNESIDDEQKCLEAWPLFSYGEDKQGHPILYDEIGSADLDKLEAAFNGDVEKLKKFHYRFMRRLANKKRNQSEKYKVKIYKHIMVMDVGGFSIKNFGARYRNLVRDVIGEEQHLFPETLYKLYIINAPWPFRTIWKILTNFIDPITVKKVAVLSGSFLEELTKDINKDQIPARYGGDGKWGEIQFGRCVPGPDSDNNSNNDTNSKNSNNNNNSNDQISTNQK